MKFYRRTDTGCWYVTFWVARDPSVPRPARRWRISTGQTALPDAKRVAEQLRRKYADAGGRPPSALPTTVSQWVAADLADAPSHQKLRTVNNCTRPRLMKWASQFGLRKLATLQNYEITDWINSLPLASGSKHRYFSVIRASLNRALRRGLIALNPLKTQDRQALPEPTRRKVQPMSPAVERQLFAAAKGSPIEIAVWLGRCAGLREEEIRHVWGEDLDFAEKSLHVTARGSWTPKSHQERVIPLPSAFVERWRGKAAVRGPVVTTSSGQAYKVYMRAIWAGLLRDAGLPHFGWHTLRHTYAARLLSAGVSIFKVSRWLGHSSVLVTESHYGHLVPETAAGADAAGPLL